MVLVSLGRDEDAEMQQGTGQPHHGVLFFIWCQQYPGWGTCGAGLEKNAVYRFPCSQASKELSWGYATENVLFKNIKLEWMLWSQGSMENSMSNEPFGFVFSGYKIINTCILGEWLSCPYTDCDKYRPVPPECHILCSWGLLSTEKGILLLFCQISLVSVESGAKINL